ncbi:hypothetical protein HK097_004638, partial [Rhizophlyctis rosea]
MADPSRAVSSRKGKGRVSDSEPIAVSDDSDLEDSLRLIKQMEEDEALARKIEAETQSTTSGTSSNSPPTPQTPTFNGEGTPESPILLDSDEWIPLKMDVGDLKSLFTSNFKSHSSTTNEDSNLTDEELALRLAAEENESLSTATAAELADFEYARKLQDAEDKRSFVAAEARKLKERKKKKKGNLDAGVDDGEIIFRTVLDGEKGTEEDHEHMQEIRDKFNKAMTHMGCKVSKVEYVINPAIHERYEACKAQFAAAGKSLREEIVFHGTESKNIPLILKEGFKVGGRGEFRAVNGSAMGVGVYTGKQPMVSYGYSRGGTCMIVAKGIPGTVCRSQRIDNTGDCVENPNVIVFKESEQLLPCYVVHFEGNPYGAMSAMYAGAGLFGAGGYANAYAGGLFGGGYQPAGGLFGTVAAAQPPQPPQPIFGQPNFAFPPPGVIPYLAAQPGSQPAFLQPQPVQFVPTPVLAPPTQAIQFGGPAAASLPAAQPVQIGTAPQPPQAANFAVQQPPPLGAPMVQFSSLFGYYEPPGTFANPNTWQFAATGLFQASTTQGAQGSGALGGAVPASSVVAGGASPQAVNGGGGQGLFGF